ncbi:MAG: DUF1549 domain-containing protein [Candidatus Solibacter sp.]|nr:DUF1549 domain-containing protein [Candidatus Solibacter sp.]
MFASRWIFVAGGIVAFGLSGMLIALTGQDSVPPSDSVQIKYAEPDCPFFGPERERFFTDALRRTSGMPPVRRLSASTDAVGKMLGFVPGGSRTYNFDQAHAAGSIDSYIFADFQANGIAPAPKTTDWEFVRRVTLDLTGRVPTADRVLAFVADTASDKYKRAKLIEELIAKPEWIDKWTMYFGDLYQNTSNRPSTSLNRFASGRNAFNRWIRDSLTSGKPYNQMATELIAASTDNTYNDGPANYLVGSVVTNGPTQDIMDQMAATTFETFLGMTHVNCLLCHNGRGHLDSVNLWATRTTRYQAWQLASHMSRTSTVRTPVDPSNTNIYYWSLLNNQRNFTTDYTLNTTTGNRPARVAPNGCKAGQPCYTVSPQYVFNGASPQPGEDYRVALARSITGDVQFARATVNYLWAYFFGRGIVDPPNTFDPARLDPDNPPPDPWTLQPSNARLLNALAQHFIDSNFNLKALMREIVNSDTYQLSSRYPGQWNAAWEPYFARKYVRRLWGEEIIDGVAQSSGSFPCATVTSGACSVPGYTVTGWTDLNMGRPSYAMQFPDVVNTEGTTNVFLDSFIRGNRDDQPRGSDGSILQALNLMNASLIENKLALTGATASPLLVASVALSNTDAVNKLFLTILSRYPSATEMSTALGSLPAASGTARNNAIQDLAWSLYNKVDFVFNY